MATKSLDKQPMQLLSRETIAEIKADLDAGRTPQLIWFGYSTDVIMATMIFYELEDEYNVGNLNWPQFARGTLAISKAFLGDDGCDIVNGGEVG